MKIGLIILMVVMYSGLCSYIGWNIYVFVKRAWGFEQPLIFAAIWMVLSLTPLVGQIEGLSVISVISNYWMVIFQYGLLIFPIVNILFLFLSKNHVVLVGYLVFGIFFLIFTVGSYMAYSPVTRTETIHVKAPELAGQQMKIVVASDFHLGILSNKKHLERFVEKSNAQQPDAVFLVGDIIDDIPKWYEKNNMKDTMKKLQASDGVYGVLGNHEYYGKQINTFVEQMVASNVTILRDESVEVGKKLLVTGREDQTNANRKTLAQLQTNSTLPWLVMDHTPKELATAEELNVAVHLSGHTHLGQLWPNQWITNRTFDLDYGYEKKGETNFIVSSGFGFWGPPIRTNSRSELWAITLQFTK